MQIENTTAHHVEDRGLNGSALPDFSAGEKPVEDPSLQSLTATLGGIADSPHVQDRLRSDMTSKVLTLESKPASQEPDCQLNSKLNGYCNSGDTAPGTQTLSTAKGELRCTRESYSSAGRQGAASGSKVFSLLGQGTSTLQAMQNPQILGEHKNDSIGVSDEKSKRTGHYGGTPKSSVGPGTDKGHSNSNSLTKKMFSQMGTNIIQGDASSVGSNSAIRNKPSSQSGMANMQTTQNFTGPVMVKKQNNFMVGSGTQLNGQSGATSAEKAATATLNSTSKRLATSLPQQYSAGASKTGSSHDSAADSAEAPSKGTRLHNATTPNSGARFAQNAPIKATAVMLPGGGAGSDGAALCQGKAGVGSPLTIEKRVADIAGILQMKAPMKEPAGPFKVMPAAGGFLTGQPAKATSNTFYPRKQASQDKQREETPEYRKLTESFRASTAPKMLTIEPSLVRKLMDEEKDERYRYLLKHGDVHFVESETFSIYVELPQIPGILIVYRRPSERQINPDKMSLNSRSLTHIPLLEGEEKVKYMNLHGNQIAKIENLVSLPNLHFLNLGSNKLTEINNFQINLIHLKALILSSNQITKIKNIQSFVNLEIIDLSDNKIGGPLDLVESFEMLTQLKTILLHGNEITSLQINMARLSLPHLQILNLAGNKITQINVERPQSSNSLALGHQSSQITESTEKALPELAELSLTGNPIANVSAQLAQIMLVNFPHIEKNAIKLRQCKSPYLMLSNQLLQAGAKAAEQVPKVAPITVQNTQVPKKLSMGSIASNEAIVPVKEAANAVEPPSPAKSTCIIPENVVPVGKSGHTAAKRKAQENAVIKIIQKEWDREAERLDAKKNGAYAKNLQGKNYGDKSLVQSGHAEIESNRILYIYGNALEVLARSEFYDVVEEMHLTYVRFDLIVYHPNLDKLRKFTKLKKLVLSHNFLNSFILLSKIECIHSLDQLYIYDNEVLNTRTLKSFIVYRFQHINEFNGVAVVEQDKKVAKQEFQLFDKILSIQNIFTRKPPSMQSSDPVRRQEIRQLQKKHAEIAHICGKTLVQTVVEQNEPDPSTMYLNNCMAQSHHGLSGAYHRRNSESLPQGTPWDGQIDAVVSSIIRETTIELGQEIKQFERDMKRSVMNKQQQLQHQQAANSTSGAYYTANSHHGVQELAT